MLDLLHKKINDIVPIIGISDNNDGTYTIDYATSPNQSELDSINTIIQNWPLEQIKINKINELDNLWNLILSQGWTTSYGWKLGLSINDVVLLNGNFTLAKEAIANNINIPIFVIDTNNEPHEFNIQDLTVLMMQYGQARATLSSLYSIKLKLIKEATSITAVNNIDISIQ